MPDNCGPISPDQQRRFERARSALEEMCPGRNRRRSDWRNTWLTEPDPETLERARWLLVAMGRARETEGGRAIEQLARRGYAVGDAHVWTQKAPRIAVRLDTPGLIWRGQILPSRSYGWKDRELAALCLEPATLLRCDWCSAHDTFRIVAILQAEGHDVG